MTCCSLKTLSYISATLQFAIFSSALGLCIFLVSLENLDDIEVGRTFLLVLLVVSVIYWVITVTLLVGLKQNRTLLVGIFLYVSHILLALGTIYVIYDFIMGFVNKEEVLDILEHLLIECVIIGVEILVTYPIHALHKRIHKDSSEAEETPTKEACDLNTDIEGNI